MGKKKSSIIKTEDTIKVIEPELVNVLGLTKLEPDYYIFDGAAISDIIAHIDNFASIDLGFKVDRIGDNAYLSITPRQPVTKNNLSLSKDALNLVFGELLFRRVITQMPVYTLLKGNVNEEKS